MRSPDSRATSTFVPTIPVVDPERITNTYAELKKMEIRLDPNPIEYGPRRFNNRIAQVRSLLTRLEQVFLQTSEDLHYFQRIISKRQALYDLEKRDLMINDPKCRVGRSQGEREALADVQLRSEIEEIQTLHLAAHDLESLMIVIKSKRTDLKDIQSRMRDQMKLIEHDLSMGSHWGQNSSSAPSLVAQSTNDIDNLLAQVDIGMGIVSEEDEEEEEEEIETETEEEDGELVKTDEFEQDPAPHIPDQVLIFGEDFEEEETLDLNEEDDSLIPNEDTKDDLLEKHVVQSEADNFLDSLESVFDEGISSSSEEADIKGIDDLIASLSDD